MIKKASRGKVKVSYVLRVAGQTTIRTPDQFRMKRIVVAMVILMVLVISSAAAGDQDSFARSRFLC